MDEFALPDRHLVVVGFWTDRAYLNDVLAHAFTITKFDLDYHLKHFHLKHFDTNFDLVFGTLRLDA